MAEAECVNFSTFLWLFHQFSEFPLFFFPPTMAQRGSPGKGLTKDEAKAAKENHFSEFIKLFTHLSIWGAKVEKRIHHLKFKFWEDRTDQPYFPRTQNMLFLKYQNLGYLQKVVCCLKILRKMVFLGKDNLPPRLMETGRVFNTKVFSFLLEIFFLSFFFSTNLSLLFFFAML